ncbi:MAG: HAMP domain-containing histidine kinase [Acidobacteria bacterium]|nr:HAMP domain-containing histidine kinase [Acidobacteriota bacterium]
MNSETISGSKIAICLTGGRIVAVNPAFRSLTGDPEFKFEKASTITEIAQHLGSRQLQNCFDDFVVSGGAEQKSSLQLDGDDFQLILHRLGGADDQDIIMVEIVDARKARDEFHLLRTGQMTARLIHDFKNQMGGLKLYAAYLKKSFSDRPEGIEIAEKIIQSLNNMAEMASLVSRLTRAFELKPEPGDPVTLIEQAISEEQAHATRRGVRIESVCERDGRTLLFDSRLLPGSIGSIIARAIDSSAEGGVVRVSLGTRPGAIEIEIADQGETLSEAQRLALFDILAIDRINKTSLQLALARRIIEDHQGSITTFASPSSGTTVRVIFKG